MNSAPVTLPCTSSTTATGGSARAVAVRASKQAVAAIRRLMADLDQSVAPEAARRLVRQLALPAREQREPYHTSELLAGFGCRRPYQAGSSFPAGRPPSWLLRAVIAEGGIALVELRLHAAAVAAEARH